MDHLARFSAETEDSAIRFFERLKWPDGFRCPSCAHTASYLIDGRRLSLYQCAACRHQTSLTANTIMEGSPLPLYKWANAVHFVSAAESVNAVQLARLVSVTYKTAWSMLRKIREAIGRSDHSDGLFGPAHIALAFYGRTNDHPVMVGPQEHPVVVTGRFDSDPVPSVRGTIYEERRTPPVNRTLRAILNSTGQHAIGSLADSPPLRDNEFPSRLAVTTVDAGLLEGKRMTDPIERIVWSHALHQQDGLLLQRLPRFRVRDRGALPHLFRLGKAWINRTFHGIGSKYLASYWNEFCFRYNLVIRNQCVASALGQRCVQAAVRP